MPSDPTEGKGWMQGPDSSLGLWPLSGDKESRRDRSVTSTSGAVALEMGFANIPLFSVFESGFGVQGRIRGTAGLAQSDFNVGQNDHMDLRLS